jgi:hypothetical protein
MKTMAGFEIQIPSWMNDEVAKDVEEMTGFLCDVIAEAKPEGVNGVAITYAMMNMIVSSLSAAFSSSDDASVRANVLLVTTSLGAMFMDNFENMQNKVPPDMVKLIMETGGNA